MKRLPWVPGGGCFGPYQSPNEIRRTRGDLVQFLLAPQGQVVDLTVLSDVDDQVVVEALRLSTQLSGGSARLQFTATTSGTFPVRLPDTGIDLATLTIAWH